MIKFTRCLSKIIAILGTIGSFVMAYFYGRKYIDASRYRYSFNSYYSREWGTTIGVFITSIISVIILTVILYSISKILENQEHIIKRIDEK